MGREWAFYNKSMNDDMTRPCGCKGECKCEATCTTCGRPWIVCKGNCNCKKKCPKKKCGCGCGCQTRFCEYGRHAHGCIRERQPECPMVAVIPTVVVETTESLKELADCFVHVANINTTFYSDDKHRMIITWAGPVEVDDYDYENNPLKLRSQTVYDFANNIAIYYNKTGGYRLIDLTES